MSLRALLTALAVPPVNLLLPCLVGVLLLRWRRRMAIALLAGGLGGLLLLGLPIVSGTLIASLEGNLPLLAPSSAPPGAIIILSGDAVLNAGVQEPGPLTLERERAGAALHRLTGLPILVTGGTVGDGDQTLAGLMTASLAADFGTSVRWIEPAAQNTAENARLSATILRAQGIGSILLVTHAWHMRRSLLAFAGTGLTVTAAPVRMDPAPKGRALDFVPRARSWQDSYYALHEWIGWAAASVQAWLRGEAANLASTGPGPPRSS